MALLVMIVRRMVNGKGLAPSLVSGAILAIAALVWRVPDVSESRIRT